MTLIGFAVYDYIAVFIRTAGCIMLLPGFSMSQLPMNVRLYIALGTSIGVFLMVESTFSVGQNLDLPQMTGLIVNELTIAAALVLSVRFLFLALSFLGEIIMSFMGLNPIPGTPIGDSQATTTLSSLFNITAVVMFFSTGLMMEFFGALIQSFIVFPPGEVIYSGEIVESISNNLSSFFNIVLRLGAPIVIYAVVMNIIAGLVNKLTPQLPVYFVSTPFLICGGLILLTWVADDILLLFHMEVEKLINELL